MLVVPAGPVVGSGSGSEPEVEAELVTEAVWAPTPDGFELDLDSDAESVMAELGPEAGDDVTDAESETCPVVDEAPSTVPVPVLASAPEAPDTSTAV